MEERQSLSVSKGLLEAVVEALRGIAERRDAEIRRAAHENAQGVLTSVREMGAVQQASADAHRRLQEMSSSLQRVGSDFAGAVGSFESSLLARDRLIEARGAVTIAIAILERFKEVSASLAADELYHALQTLTSLRTLYISELQYAQAGTSNAQEISTHSSSARLLGPLAPLILTDLRILEDELEQKLTTSLHKWLTEARYKAAEVGRRALQAVQDTKRCQRERAARRAELVQHLQNGEKTIPPHSKCLSRTDCASKVTEEDIEKQENAAAAAAADAGGSGLDLSLLLRCVLCYATQGRLHRLLTLYTEARQAQLGADLVPPEDLIICHASFLEGLVGYFVVEAHVNAAAPQLGSMAHVEAAWEGASAAIAAEVGAGMDESSDSNGILELKESALLACEAIESCWGGALTTRGIRGTLVNRGMRYRATVAAGAAPELLGMISTSNVEELMEKIFLGFKTYLNGLVPSSELPGACVSECYHAVAAVVSSAAAAHAASSLPEVDMMKDDFDHEASIPGASLQRCFSLLASGHAACDALEAQAIRAVAPASTLEEGAGQLDGALVHLQKWAGKRVATAASPALARCAELDYYSSERIMPRCDPSRKTGGTETNITNSSEPFTDILEVLRGACTALDACSVPRGRRAAVLASALSSIGDQVLSLVASHVVPTLTVYGVQGLLSDLSTLGQFADEQAGGRRPCLAEPLNVCEAIAFDSAEDLLDPAARSGKGTFSGTNFERVAVLLDKIRDVGGWAATPPDVACHNNNNNNNYRNGGGVRMLTRTKAAEIAKQLRAAVALEGGGPGPGGTGLVDSSV